MGIKFTDYNLMDFQTCTQVGNGKYNMLYGRDEQLFAALELGADTGVSSTIQYAPSLREVWSLYKKGDKVGAKKAQEINAKLHRRVWRQGEGHVNIHDGAAFVGAKHSQFTRRIHELREDRKNGKTDSVLDGGAELLPWSKY